MRKVNVSIIIPAYNAETTITRCIKSIQNQTYTNFEVIVINDGSTDKTADIVSQICTTDDRIRLCSQANNGVSCARNVGLSYAAGKYIIFVDSDDYIQNHYLQTYFETAEKENADVVIGGCKRKDLKSSETVEIAPPMIGDITFDIWKQLTENIPVLGYVCSKIIKRNIIENNNIRYSEKMYSQEDLSFNLDVYDRADKIIAIDDTSYIYEYRESNRKPDIVGYINNQIKLLNICYKKHVLTEEMKNSLRFRLENYCFGYLLYSENREQAIKQLHEIEGLDDVLKEIIIKNERDYVCWMLAHSYDLIVKMHFNCRAIIKKVLCRGDQ